MFKTTLEKQQQIKDVKDNLARLSSAMEENIIYIIKPFLALLKDPENYPILNHGDLYPYFAALIKDHSAILKGLGLIDAELVFQGGATPLVELMGIYKLALFTFNNVQLEQPLDECLNDYSFSAQHGNLHAATALIQYYFRELPKMPEDNFESFVGMVNESVFSDPTVLRASGFFLAAQLYYQISQSYLEKEKKEFADDLDKLKSSNAFRYFRKSILHYITAGYLFRMGHGQESMPLVVTEETYPSIEDEEKFIQYVRGKVIIFKQESDVLLNCYAVEREARLKAKSYAHEYDARIAHATKPLNVEEQDKTIQKILNELKSISSISYPGAYFSPASDDARAGPSDAAAIPGLKQW